MRVALSDKITVMLISVIQLALSVLLTTQVVPLAIATEANHQFLHVWHLIVCCLSQINLDGPQEW